MNYADKKEQPTKYDKILIISDVHGLIEELKEFLDFIKDKYQDTVAYAVHLGDFFKGRNVIKGQKTFTFWKDIEYIEKKFPFPVHCIKGNEDINIPSEWWTSTDLLNLIPDKQEFMLEDFKIIPVHYFDENKDTLKENGIRKLIQNKNHPKTNIYNPLFDYLPFDDGNVPEILIKTDPVDFVMAHVPPYGLLDKTRDYSTHKEIKFTGSKLIRLIVDRRKPKFVFFGHNHFCNYKIYNQMIVISIDKFCRKIPSWADDNYLDFNYKKQRKKASKVSKKSRKRFDQKDSNKAQKEKNIFSYCLITKSNNEFKLEIYRKNLLVFQFDGFERKVLYSKM